MGGLKAEIADGIKMFKPKILKEAINLARMRDDQLQRQWRTTRMTSRFLTETTAPSKVKTIPTAMKRLT